jgi:hypothetical protein
LFVEGFRLAGGPVCMTAEEIAQFPTLNPLPQVPSRAGCEILISGWGRGSTAVADPADPGVGGQFSFRSAP